MIPQLRPGQPFRQHQLEVAQWVGCSVDDLNAHHDALHGALCRWLGVPSHSLACARSDTHDAALAALEEEAVMHVQRFMAHHGVGVPQ